MAKGTKDFKDGLFTKQGMLIGAYTSDNELVFGIQVTKPKSVKKGNKKYKGAFTKHDFQMMKFLAMFLGWKAENILIKHDIEKKKLKIMQII